MGLLLLLVLSSLMGSFASVKVKLEADRPFLRVQLFDEAILECCYQIGKGNLTWIKHSPSVPHIIPVKLSENVVKSSSTKENIQCGLLTLKKAELNDTGMYKCFLNDSKICTHGTYLQVFKRVEKTFDLSESTKNKILTAEGVLLMLCVILPSVPLLFKSKKQTKLEMKKMKPEEENIYQGLNLEDCCTTYDQIERSQAQGQYQDVCNAMEEREESLLEKP